MAVTFSDQRDYTQSFCTKQKGAQRQAGHRLTKFKVKWIIKIEAQQNLSHSMCTCTTVSIVCRSLPDLIATMDILGTRQLKFQQILSQSEVEPQPSQLNRITCAPKSVCVQQGRSACGQTEFTPCAAPWDPERHGPNWALLHIVHWTWNWNCEIQALWENDMKTFQSEQVQMNMTQSSCVACGKSLAEMAAEHTE